MFVTQLRIVGRRLNSFAILAPSLPTLVRVVLGVQIVSSLILVRLFANGTFVMLHHLFSKPELRDRKRYYDERVPGLGSEFIDEFER